MDPIAGIFQTAEHCARIAVQMCQSFRPESVPAERKLDKTWVTEADQSIEATLRDVIAAAHPTHTIVGEEQGGTLAEAPDAYSWILDPIDGTFSFIHGIPFYSSLLAVLKGGVPIIGFACLPGLGITLSAIRGRGVWINGQPLVRSPLLGHPAIEIVATADPYRFRMEGRQATLEALYGEPFKARTYPDALGYYLLLQGSVRAFVDPKVEIWDVAPFHVILPEAGFAIHPWEGDRTLRRGTSVAYPVAVEGTNAGQPLESCRDVLAVLQQATT